MVVDPSVVVAIFLEEPDAEDFSLALRRAGVRRMSTASLFEAGIVLDQRAGLEPEEPNDELRALLQRVGIELVPFTERHAQIARVAYRRYGKGRHPAGLNFGDCMSYALAKSLDEPLLFKGTDFSLTDVKVVK
jgi:ribonuclease VapC